MATNRNTHAMANGNGDRPSITWTNIVMMMIGLLGTGLTAGGAAWTIFQAQFASTERERDRFYSEYRREIRETNDRIHYLESRYNVHISEYDRKLERLQDQLDREHVRMVTQAELKLLLTDLESTQRRLLDLERTRISQSELTTVVRVLEDRIAIIRANVDSLNRILIVPPVRSAPIPP